MGDLVLWCPPGCVSSLGHQEEATRRLRCAILAGPVLREERGIADVRAALPDGETCTDEEARDFLTARGEKLGEEEPW